MTAIALADAGRGRVTAIAVAAASGAAISASTWPPPTVCKTRTGLRPTSAVASGARSGRVRLAVSATKPVAAAIASPATSLNTRIVVSSDPAHVRAIAALANVNTGPYTECVCSHCPGVTATNGSWGKDDNLATYGSW